MNCPICRQPIEKGGLITIEIMEDGSLYLEHFNQKYDETPWCMEALLSVRMEIMSTS